MYSRALTLLLLIIFYYDDLILFLKILGLTPERSTTIKLTCNGRNYNRYRPKACNKAILF